LVLVEVAQAAAAVHKIIEILMVHTVEAAEVQELLGKGLMEEPALGRGTQVVVVALGAPGKATRLQVA